jgi:hypothetical protein
MKKVTVILICLFALGLMFSVLQSCEKHPYGGPYKQTFYKLDSLQAEQHRIVGIKTDSTSTFNLKYLILDSALVNNGIRYDSIAINIHNHFEEIESRIALQQYPFRFSSTLATEPFPSPVRYDYLLKVIVTSSEDYNDTLPKESNLAGIMSVHDQLSIWGNNFSTYMPYSEMHYDYLTYTFKAKPTESKFHNLTFKYILADSSEISTTINNVFIKN